MAVVPGDSDDRIALVLAGGGARGAYEAGALSVLLPLLEERGERPTIIVGTSVGALTAAFVAATADKPAKAAIAEGTRRWREVTKDDVIGPVLLKQAPMAAARVVGSLLPIGGSNVQSLLDPAPLAENLDTWIDWRGVRSNIDAGLVQTLAVVATAAATGRTVVFLDTHTWPRIPSSHMVEYVDAEIGNAHVRASAAIPIAFPPVRVDTPAAAAGWYIDGGIRFNTPIKPALDLGADRLVVVGTGSIEPPERVAGSDSDTPPSLADAALHVLHGALVDPLIQDLRTLGQINRFYLEDGGGADPETGPARLRAAEGKDPFRLVPYIFTSPRKRGAIGELAAEVFDARYGGPKALRSLDFGVLNAVLDGDSPQHGELLSYLFFDPEFIEELIRMGREDCEAWLRRAGDGGDLWQIGPPSERNYRTGPAGGAAGAGSRDRAGAAPKDRGYPAS